MKRVARLLVILIAAWAGLLPAYAAKQEGLPPLPKKVLQAQTVLLLCECPRGLAVAEGRALQELILWGRFKLVYNPRAADLVILFSANEYLGDYLTRDGPDKRPIRIDFTIMTVIDPKTGAKLWSDSRRWGSWFVDKATKALMEEFRGQIEAETKRWTLNDILTCSVSPELASFAHLTAEEALARSKSGINRVAESPDRLTFSSPGVPEFCKQAQLIVGPDDTIVAFEVHAPLGESFELMEVLQQADQFDFVGGRDTKSDQVYFGARSKDGKVLMKFEMQGHKSVLSWIRYSY